MHVTRNLHPATCIPQPATRNLQPATHLGQKSCSRSQFTPTLSATGSVGRSLVSLVVTGASPPGPPPRRRCGPPPRTRPSSPRRPGKRRGYCPCKPSRKSMCAAPSAYRPHMMNANECQNADTNRNALDDMGQSSQPTRRSRHVRSRVMSFLSFAHLQVAVFTSVYLYSPLIMMPRLKASPLAGFTATSPRPDRDFVVGRTYLVTRGDAERESNPPRARCDATQRRGTRFLALHADTSGPATALNSRRARNGMQEAYVTFAGEDKRLDAWIPSSALGAEVAAAGPSRLAGALEALVCLLLFAPA